MAHMKSQKVNICETDDVYNRYKRDKIEMIIIAKCGGQTKITNLQTIAKQLHVDEPFLVKEMQKILSLPIRTNNTLSGHVDITKLEDALKQVIQKHVLCPNCGLPELDKHKTCRACGE